VIDEQTHHQTGRVPPAGDDAAVNGLLGALRIRVEYLRIELPPELDNFVFRNRNRAELVNRAGLIILEVTVLDRDRKT
jgi:hypothetical protein